MDHLTAAAIVASFALIYYFRARLGAEFFTDRPSKSREIISWFQRNPEPKYNDYRRAISGDIVEYDDMLALFKSGRLTAENIAGKI